MPRKVFTAGEVLTSADVNEYLMDQTIMTFAGTAARGSAIGTATEGMVTYLADSDSFEFWDGSSYQPLASGTQGVLVDYLVIGGGGSGGRTDGSNYAGGGGAGGYRLNVTGETSGGGLSAEPALFLPLGTYSLVVGAGGSSASTTAWTSGNDSILFNVRSQGGGYGGGLTSVPAWRPANVGGSSGGMGEGNDGSVNGITAQGFGGGAQGGGSGGGGGGAAGAGGNGGASGGTGGAGESSSITGSSVARAGGGGGGGSTNGSATAGGGAGTVAGTANTGGGGGSGANGGSGIIVFRVPTGTSVSFTGGVTQTNSTVGANQVYVVTATSTTSETVTFA